MAQAWVDAGEMEIGYGWPGNMQETESGEQVGEETTTAEGVYYHPIADEG
jgi:hypothetical protein